MKYYLVVSAFTYAQTLIPNTYSSEQECHEAGSKMQYHYCIPAPKPTICKSVIDGPNGRMVCE